MAKRPKLEDLVLASRRAVEREAAASGARDLAADAAAAGREKYGAKKMGKLAAKGRERHEREARR